MAIIISIPGIFFSTLIESSGALYPYVACNQGLMLTCFLRFVVQRSERATKTAIRTSCSDALRCHTRHCPPGRTTSAMRSCAEGSLGPGIRTRGAESGQPYFFNVRTSNASNGAICTCPGCYASLSGKDIKNLHRVANGSRRRYRTATGKAVSQVREA